MKLDILKSLKEILASLENPKLSENDIEQFKYYLDKIEDKSNEILTEKNLNKEYNEKEDLQKQKSFNGLTASEWARSSKNVWNDLSSPRNKKHLVHGATYSLKLAERVIKNYSKEGDLVFDPFLGTGTTLLAGKALNRSGIGIELVKKFYKFSKEQLEVKDLISYEQKVFNDDCRNLDKYLEDNSIQLTLTSPPYADFIHKTILDRKTAHKDSAIVSKNNSKTKPYSDLSEDFGNLSYDKFLKESKILLENIYKKTRPNGYNAWVVKDYRDTKNKMPYIPFHSDLARIGEEAGFKFHDLIVWDQNAQRSLILLGYPSVFYSNQNCSFIVIFRKS